MTSRRDVVNWKDRPTEAGEEGRPRDTDGPADHDARRRLATLLGRLFADDWKARHRDGPTDGDRARRTDDANP